MNMAAGDAEMSGKSDRFNHPACDTKLPTAAVARHVVILEERLKKRRERKNPPPTLEQGVC